LFRISRFVLRILILVKNRPDISERVAPLGHTAISASAGSGKTYALAHRYIGLLARGEAPDHIIALTFSRKAAGEIFDSVVENLRKAAVEPAAARAKSADIGLPRLRREDFLGLLRGFLNQLHRVHIGTLDSFIVGVARAFPAELGIPSSFEVMDTGGAAATEFRNEALASLFDPKVTAWDSQRQFLEAYKQATFGREEKGFGSKIGEFIEGYRETFQLLPDLGCWGRASLLWPEGCPWLQDGGGDAGADAAALKDAVAASGWPDKALEKWIEFADAAAAFEPGSNWEPLRYLYPRLAAVHAGLSTGDAELKLFRAARRLTHAECRAAHALFARVTAAEIRTAMEKTAGIGNVLARFEAVYDERMRASGKLTFSDAQYLLTEANDWSRGALLSRKSPQEHRIYIDYRLDCKLDHWLLDEFQDTSDLQWAAIRNLADEILQDDSRRRSLFYVGDVKQSIYAWRGGNSRLFGDILDQYGDVIEERHLDTCRRSAPAIVSAVNDVFGDLAQSGLPAGAIGRWSAIWKTHEPDESNRELPGYVALLAPPGEEDDGDKAKGGESDEDPRHRLAAELLRAHDPLSRGLSTAVLVRTNAAGRAVTDAIRRICPGMPVVHEGESPLLDNAAVAVLLSLVRFAAHPGDMMAWRHLQMSPLGQGGLRSNELPLEVLHIVHDEGFASLMARWAAVLRSHAPLDAFAELRVSQLVEAAREFDARGDRDCDAFARFIEERQVGDVAEQGAVRVMTVHKSKGLGFDMVILPELDEAMDSLGRLDLLVGRDPERHLPRWVLNMPRRDVAATDAVLAAELNRATDEGAYDALCVLYVAMTRAKRALYMIGQPRGEKSKTLDFFTFLGQQLGGAESGGAAARAPRLLWEAGTSQWLPERGAVSATAPAAPPDTQGYAARPSRRNKLQQVEPSGEDEDVRSGAALFEPEKREVLDFGTAIHELFEKVAWAEESDADAIVEQWQAGSRCSEDVRRDVCRQFLDAMKSADVRQALQRPRGACELWKEKRFEVVLNVTEWVTGAFDRVVIELGSAGRPKTATILDYKSNRVSTEPQMARAAEHYRGQLSLYARALAHILRVPLKAIRTQILFTRTGRIWDISAP
jgi:ATP-dependent helicase/nuclease subunit A